MSTTGVRRATSPATMQRLLRAGGVAGMLMLPVFALVVVVMTWLKWDFLHGLGWTVVDAGDVSYPSSLARGDLGAVQTLNFLALGVLAFVFLRGLRTQFVHRVAGLVATIGLAAVALAGVLSAFPTNLPGEPASWYGLLHGIGFLLLMLGNFVAFIAAGLALRGAPGWGRLWIYSLVNAAVAVLVAIVLAPLGQVSFYLLIIVLLSWYTLLGARMHRLATP